MLPVLMPAKLGTGCVAADPVLVLLALLRGGHAAPADPALPTLQACKLGTGGSVVSEPVLVTLALLRGGPAATAALAVAGCSIARSRVVAATWARAALATRSVSSGLSRHRAVSASITESQLSWPNGGKLPERLPKPAAQGLGISAGSRGNARWSLGPASLGSSLICCSGGDDAGAGAPPKSFAWGREAMPHIVLAARCAAFLMAAALRVALLVVSSTARAARLVKASRAEADGDADVNACSSAVFMPMSSPARCSATDL